MKIKTKRKLDNIIGITSGLFLVLSLVVLALNLLGSIGYALYLWSHEMPLALSLWTAFVLWFKILVGGLLTLGISWLINTSVD